MNGVNEESRLLVVNKTKNLFKIGISLFDFSHRYKRKDRPTAVTRPFKPSFKFRNEGLP